MTTLACDRCGESFNTDREPAVPGADTSRCPACGCPHEVNEPATGDQVGTSDERETVTVDGGGSDGVEVHIHVGE